MTAAQKDTIYIDAEDEITAIIDKMRASPSKIVALVLPKRSSTLHSVVNLKLLKRTAAESKKNLVLITSEANLLPLAGLVGLHVAKTLQSKPSVPAAPNQSEAPITVDDVGTDEAPELDPNAPIGELAGVAGSEETIDLDNDKPAAVPAIAAAKGKLNKKLKIPDFDRFRLMLFGGIGLLILLLIGSYFAFSVLPKAKIVIKTDTSSVAIDMKLTANTEAKELNAETGVVPGINKQIKKTDSEKVPATGQRDEGTKAKGTATLALTDCSKDQVTVPAGTPLTANSLSFLTNSEVTLKSVKIGAQCRNDDFKDFSTATINVTAQNAGDKYNLGARAYTVTGFSNVSANGSNMTGGTTKLVQIVSQSDIDNAKQKVLERMSAAAIAELKSQFTAENALPLEDTLATSDPVVASTPNAGETATDVSVNVSASYTVLGVKQDDLEKLIEDEVKKRIDNNKQTIQDNGLSKAVLRLSDKVSPTQAKFDLKTIAIAGAQLDAEGIKKEIAGKKKGATQTIISERPGIRDVEVKYSPFWVHSTPKKTSKITITFEQINEEK